MDSSCEHGHESYTFRIHTDYDEGVKNGILIYVLFAITSSSWKEADFRVKSIQLIFNPSFLVSRSSFIVEDEEARLYCHNAVYSSQGTPVDLLSGVSFHALGKQSSLPSWRFLVGGKKDFTCSESINYFISNKIKWLISSIIKNTRVCFNSLSSSFQSECVFCNKFLYSQTVSNRNPLSKQTHTSLIARKMAMRSTINAPNPFIEFHYLKSLIINYWLIDWLLLLFLFWFCFVFPLNN